MKGQKRGIKKKKRSFERTTQSANVSHLLAFLNIFRPLIQHPSHTIHIIYFRSDRNRQPAASPPSSSAFLACPKSFALAYLTPHLRPRSPTGAAICCAARLLPTMDTYDDSSSLSDDDLREESPDEPQQQQQTALEPLACVACRARKLKCDRTKPACSRCTKASDGTVCVYPESRRKPMFKRRNVKDIEARLGKSLFTCCSHLLLPLLVCSPPNIEQPRWKAC